MPEARLGAELLLARVLETDRVGLYLIFDRPVATEEKDAFRSLVKRRANREPVAYILGEKEFYSLSFKVSPGVLIPRPETEILVEDAARELGDANLPAPLGRPVAADVGAGSAAVACALAMESPGAAIVATEISPGALAVARENVAAHELTDRVHLVMADLLECIRPGVLSVVVSNPPYIPEGEIAGLAAEIGFEPREAIDGGEDGLAVIRRLAPRAADALVARGRLLMEIGYSQAEDAAGLLEAHGFGDIKITKDLAGIDRVIRGVKHG